MIHTVVPTCYVANFPENSVKMNKVLKAEVELLGARPPACL